MRRAEGPAAAGFPVHLWLMPHPERLDAVARAVCEGFLSDCERVQWQRYLLPAVRNRYLVSRALVRTALSSLAGIPPSSWVFGRSPCGRPFVREPRGAAGLQFNVSHTQGLVAVAIADGREVGVDVESVGRRLDVERFASYFFSPGEAEQIRRGGSCGARDLFYSFWTLKEAYIKARGEGFAVPLDSFWFELAPASARLQCLQSCDGRPERWWFYRSAPSADHKLALAVGKSGVCGVEVRQCWAAEVLGISSKELVR